MDTSDLVPGDLIFLKSGSPELKVIRVIGDAESPRFARMDKAMALRGYEDGDVLVEWAHEGRNIRKAFKAAMLHVPGDEAAEEDAAEESVEEEKEDDLFTDDDFDF